MNPFEGIDFLTPEGAKVKRLIEARLAQLRTKREDIGLSDRDSCIALGGILELRALLKKPVAVVPLASYNERRVLK